MNDYYAEVRRMEAQERLKQKSREPVAVVSNPLTKPQANPRREKVASPRKSWKPREQKESRVYRRQVVANCCICGGEYRVYACLADEVRTCKRPECSSRMRSLAQQKRYSNKEIRTCTNPLCDKLLNPNRASHAQKLYCSVKCAAIHRNQSAPKHRCKNPFCEKTILSNKVYCSSDCMSKHRVYKKANIPFKRGDRVSVEKSGVTFEGVVTGVSVGKVKRLAVKDVEGNTAYVSPNKARLISCD